MSDTSGVEIPESIARELDEDKLEYLKSLAPDELAALLELLEAEDPEQLLQPVLSLEYDEVPVDPETFFTDPYYLGVTGSSIYPKILDDLIECFSGDYIEVLLGGCLAYDTIVMSENGSLRTLGEMLGESGSVLTVDGSSVVGADFSKVGPSGVVEVVEVVLENGMAVRATPDHRIKVFSDHSGYLWVPAGHLSEGDLVVVADTAPVVPDTYISEDEARELALSLDLRSPEARVPDDLCRSFGVPVSVFLEWVFTVFGKRTGGCVELATASEIFVRQVQLLLLRFGVKSTVFRDFGVGEDCWGVRVCVGDGALTSDYLLDHPLPDASSGVSRVVRVEQSGTRVPVGDVRDVSQYQSWLANGMLVHNSIGWGKSTFTEFGMLRLAYEVLCLKDPQAAFGLMPGSKIVIVNLSVTEAQAKRAIFSGIKEKVSLSPWFQEVSPYDRRITTELRFPKNVSIFPGASTNNAILGLNVIGGALDEANFMPVKDGSKKALGNEVYDKAQELYTAMLRRMKSRFLKDGRLPGKLFLPSSAQYPGDFVDRRMREAINDPTVFVRNYALWEVKREQYSSEVFYVEVGTDMQGSRIITEDVDPSTIVGKVIEVPMDFYNDFEKDIDGAIRDIAGISTLTVDQYFKRFSSVLECVDDSRVHPFTAESTTLEDGHGLLKSAYLDEDGYLRYNPDAPRVVHIDQSLSMDCTGIAVGHIADLVKVRRSNPHAVDPVVEEAPLIFYDLILRVVPPKGREIQLDYLRDIIYALTDDGMDIQVVTMDTWQSAEALQQFARRGYHTESLSVDKSIVPYETLKQAFYERRVNMYRYQPALVELRRLEIDHKKKKVDHPPRGSKDVADAMAGVAFTLTMYASDLYKPEISAVTFG